MISIKTSKQIELMSVGGKILAGIIREIASHAKPGATTRDLDRIAGELCEQHKVKPAFLGYGVAGKKYPAVACLSVNDAIVHAIPTNRPLQDGDVLGIDMGVIYKGWNSDSAATVLVIDGKFPIFNFQFQKKLIEVTKQSMYLGIEQARPGNHVGDVGYAVQTYVESHGFGVVRELVGHGIGRELHEEPRVPNFGKPGEGEMLKEGMVICIEPMVTAGDWKLVLDDDGWAYRTNDGSPTAHFEHTVAITKNGPVVLT